MSSCKVLFFPSVLSLDISLRAEPIDLAMRGTDHHTQLGSCILSPPSSDRLFRLIQRPGPGTPSSADGPDSLSGSCRSNVK